MKNPQVSETTTGLVIAALVGLLILISIATFWEAQVIAQQRAVIQLLQEK